MNALKIVQNAGLHCHSRPDECGEQQKYGEKRTKEAHKSSIMLKTDGRTKQGMQTLSLLWNFIVKYLKSNRFVYLNEHHKKIL